MGTRRRLSASARVVFVAFALACSSCKREEKPLPPAETKPSDHLVAGEAVEGKDRAFGLPLPRLARVAARFEKTVDVYSPLSPEDLVNFVRTRVKDGRITPGSSSTLLVDVVPLGDPQKRLSIDVHLFHGADSSVRSEMIVRDTTPLPTEPGLTDEQRWKKQGLTSDGHIADPTHLQ
jgi:hypothetical protein